MASPSVGPRAIDARSFGNSVELADVVRRFAPEYMSHYGPLMMPSQKRALADIAACCTAEMGGRLHRCDDCQETFGSYHCCRNRSCPKCHGRQTQQWLEKRQAELLPCDYFHAVATVPSELRNAFRREQKYLYGLLMKVSAEAVKELCAQKRHLGALPGILAVLHTWTGELRFHPHVHLLITAGGITPDAEHFEPARRKFLVAARFTDQRRHRQQVRQIRNLGSLAALIAVQLAGEHHGRFHSSTVLHDCTLAVDPEPSLRDDHRNVPFYNGKEFLP